MQSREMTLETYNRFMNDVIRQTVDLLNSSQVHEKLGGVTGISELIDIESADDATKITRLVNALRVGLQCPDPAVITIYSKALGKLARSSGTLTAEFVELEVRRALEWLSTGDPRNEMRRPAAVLILMEMASNAPTLFYVHVAQFFDLVWFAIHDQSPAVREGAVAALRAAL